MSYSTSPRPPRRARWFAPSSIPPILLLTFVTSFAFNHALISTQRKQDVRLHRIRTALLEETIDYNTRLLAHLVPPSPSSSILSRLRPQQKMEEKGEPEWVRDEREALVRRWRTLGTDPFREGLIAPTSRNDDKEIEREGGVGEERRRVGPKDVTWSEIFLGSREKRSSLTERWQKVTAGIKDSFTNLTPTSSPRTQQEEPDQSEEEELQQLAQLWSQASKSS